MFDMKAAVLLIDQSRLNQFLGVFRNGFKVSFRGFGEAYQGGSFALGDQK